MTYLYEDDSYEYQSDGPGEYLHLPTVKRAFQYDGTNGFDIALWSEGRAYVSDVGQLVVRFKPGELIASPGDFIVEGTEGELYPCPAAIFADNYQPVGERS